MRTYLDKNSIEHTCLQEIPPPAPHDVRMPADSTLCYYCCANNYYSVVYWLNGRRTVVGCKSQVMPRLVLRGGVAVERVMGWFVQSIQMTTCV